MNKQDLIWILVYIYTSVISFLRSRRVHKKYGRKTVRSITESRDALCFSSHGKMSHSLDRTWKTPRGVSGGVSRSLLSLLWFLCFRKIYHRFRRRRSARGVVTLSRSARGKLLSSLNRWKSLLSLRKVLFFEPAAFVQNIRESTGSTSVISAQRCIIYKAT